MAVVEQTGSTSEDLRAWLTAADGYLDSQAARSWPHLSALHACHQCAGRGRLDRQWVTPPGQALLISFVLRPLLSVEDLGWVPLVAGLAVCEALAGLLSGSRGAGVRDAVRVGTKWPNDVVLLPGAHRGWPPVTWVGDVATRRRGGPRRPGVAGDGAWSTQASAQEPAWTAGWGQARKVAGVLTDLVMPAQGLTGATGERRPDRRWLAPALIVGIGVNVSQTEDLLPVPWATSLRLSGWTGEVDEVRDAVGSHVAAAVTELEAQAPFTEQPVPASAGVRERLEQSCTTLGQWVTVRTPGGQVRGEAIGLDPALVVRTGSGVVRVAAGDVVAVRAGSGGG